MSNAPKSGERSDDDLARLQDMFDAAVELPEDARRAFLQDPGLDPPMRVELEALLEAHASEGPLDEMAAALASDDTLDAGQVGEDAIPDVIGPYRVHEAIGRGGMATVYRGQRLGDEEGVTVALKVLRWDADSGRIRRRFMVERQILAGLRHDNIAAFLDDGITDDGRPFLVTQYVDGDRIDRFCERGHLTLDDRLGLFLEACRAVEYAHGRGVVHRDLKPDNVLVTTEGRVVLLDFGIAKLLDRQAFPGVGGPTTSGVHLLTFGYASPEQLRGEPITPASDIYQLGLLLVKLATGRLPPVHERSARPPPIDWTAAGGFDDGHRSVATAAALDPIVRKALNITPTDRHSSVSELVGEVEATLAPAPPGHRPRPAGILSSLVFLVLLLAALGALLF